MANKSHYSLRLVRITEGMIAIGVIDSKLKHLEVYDWKQPNMAFYFGSFCQVSAGGRPSLRSKKYTKVKNGDIVTVHLCQQKGEIRWEINGEQEENQLMEKLKDKDIEWVPYIRFHRTGDEV